MQIDLSWHGLTQPGSGQDYFGIDPLPRFDPDRVAFDPANAFWLSEICRLFYRRNPDESSYRNGAKARDVILAEAACEEIHFIGRQEIQCALMQSQAGPKPFAVLVFRGTTGFRNWLLDLDVRPEKMGPRATVHRGFIESLEQIWERLQPALEGLAIPCFFTGHSMGGALAQLAATRFRPQAVYCFGAPRVGDAGYAQLMHPIPVYRVVNNRDIVAVLPPASPILAFQPAGQLVHICARGFLRQIDDEAATLDCADEETPAAASEESRWYDPPRFLADHAPINYSARIGQYLLGVPGTVCDNDVCPPLMVAAAAGP
ncbi:MAG: lipase family protein [Desulfobacterales bacterium]|nr:lipase family protein [Desulfobacterales bacterium]